MNGSINVHSPQLQDLDNDDELLEGIVYKKAMSYPYASLSSSSVHHDADAGVPARQSVPLCEQATLLPCHMPNTHETGIGSAP